MRRLAELPRPLRYLVIALLLLAFVLLLRWLEDEPKPPGAPPVVMLHVELQPGAAPPPGSRAAVHPPAVDALRRRSARALGTPRRPRRSRRRTLARLARDPRVEQAFAAPAISLPRRRAPLDDDRCPITRRRSSRTRATSARRRSGIDAPAAWRRGVRGQGVWFADIEGGWNAAHEDLPGERITHVARQADHRPELARARHRGARRGRRPRQRQGRGRHRARRRARVHVVDRRHDGRRRDRRRRRARCAPATCS